MVRNVKVDAPPFIASSEALRVATRAAQAVGLTVQQLADLMVDGGVTAIPPKAKEAIQPEYTLEDLGKRLWGEVSAVPKTKRCDWFSGLLDTQKAALVVVLRDRGYASETIAREFGVDVEMVIRTWHGYASKIGSQVVGMRLDTLAGQMQVVAERAQQMAMEADDHKAVWSIEKEKLAALQSLGVVDKAIHRVEVSHKFDDQSKAEIEALVKLRQKQQVRLEEVKMIEAETERGDALPVLDEVEDRE